MPRRIQRGIRCAVLLLSACAFAPIASAAGAGDQYASIPKWDSAVRELRRAVRYSRDGSHHALLMSLRQMRDPSLKPLFQSLVQAEYWSIQVDGVFGLAELDPNGLLDPFLLAQVKSPADRSTAIAAAVQLGMVGREQASAMLAWENLAPRDRILLWAELKHRGGEVDVAAVTELLGRTEPEIVGIAGFLLASQGVSDALAKVTSRLSDLSVRDRANALVGLAAAAATFELKSATPLLDGALKDSALAVEARVACVGAILTLDPERGYAAWKSAIESSTTQSQRVRLALVLLTANFPLPRGAAAPLRAVAASPDAPADPLLGRLADAIDAVANSDVRTAFPALVATRHRPSLAAVLLATKRIDPEGQRATYEAFANLALSKDSDAVSGATLDLCIDALSRLATLDARAIGSHLDTLGDTLGSDESWRDLLMVSLYGAATKEAAEVAYAHRTNASKGSASMALLLHARHAATLTAAELEELGTIAAGGTPLDAALQVQAAWLYARHSGTADQTIAALLAPEPAAGSGASVGAGDPPTSDPSSSTPPRASQPTPETPRK